MGNIIKINMYAELKRKQNYKLQLEALKENILKYNAWLKRTNREDKVESYEEFLRVQ